MSKRRSSTNEESGRSCSNAKETQKAPTSKKLKVRKRPHSDTVSLGRKLKCSPILTGFESVDNKIGDDQETKSSALLTPKSIISKSAVEIQNQLRQLKFPAYTKSIGRLTSDAWCPKQDPNLYLHLDQECSTAFDSLIETQTFLGGEGIPAVPSNEKLPKVKYTTPEETRDTMSTQNSFTNAGKVVPFSDKDVLLGRGGMTNKHPGNQSFRRLVEDTKPMYKGYSSKTKKKEVSQLVVDDIEQRGGNFLKKRRKLRKDPDSPYEWVIASPDEARKKASQALRETCVKTSQPQK